jgi:hypothetical protein
MIIATPIAYREFYPVAAQAAVPTINHLQQDRNTMHAGSARQASAKGPGAAGSPPLAGGRRLLYVTVVIEVLNSADTVVGSRSWAGQNAAPHQVMNETYAWTAPTAGTYTIEGRIRASSGKILKKAQAGTIKVN